MNTKPFNLILENLIKTERRRVESIINGHFNSQKIIASMGISVVQKGIYNLIEVNSNHTAKQMLSSGGMFYDWTNTNYNSAEEYWFPLPELSKVILSDNTALFYEINNRKRLTLNKDRSGIKVKNKALFEIAAGDWEGLADTNQHFHEVFENFDDPFSDKDHFKLIYSGFLKKDAKKIEEGLNNLESDDLRKIRIKYFEEEQYLSIMTIALSKLAWMHGLEVEVKSKYVPEELMKFNPLKEYPIQYRFLRDFYRDMGLDWSYEPVYPELQDWENDPENPNKE